MKKGSYGGMGRKGISETPIQETKGKNDYPHLTSSSSRNFGPHARKAVLTDGLQTTISMRNETPGGTSRAPIGKTINSKKIIGLNTTPRKHQKERTLNHDIKGDPPTRIARITRITKKTEVSATHNASAIEKSDDEWNSLAFLRQIIFLGTLYLTNYTLLI